jgi:hypothetical protein
MSEIVLHVFIEVLQKFFIFSSEEGGGISSQLTKSIVNLLATEVKTRDVFRRFEISLSISEFKLYQLSQLRLINAIEGVSRKNFKI